MKDIVIFGSGATAKDLLEDKDFALTVKAIVDNDKTKWGKKLSGIEIQSPQILNQQADRYYVLIMTVKEVFQRQIENQLKKMGYDYGKNYCFAGSISTTNGVPGLVSGYVSVPSGYTGIKSFDPASHLVVTSDKRIFRVVNPDYEEKYRNVLDRCRKANLFGHYLVDTKDVTKEIAGFHGQLVLEHEYIEPITYAYEWSPAMFSDYVNFMIDFQKKLIDADLGLADGHILNCTLYQGHFLFLDYGAISDQVESNDALMNFFNTHVIPMVLIKRGQINKAYMMMRNTGIAFSLTDIFGYLNSDEIDEANQILDHIANTNDKKDAIRILDEIQSYLNNLVGTYGLSAWADYQKDEWDWSASTEKWSAKMRNVITMEKLANPSTVIDIAGNMGWYGAFLHDDFKYSVILDVDSTSIDKLWERINQNMIKNVVPVYMSFCTPTTDYYRDDAIGNTAIMPWRPNAIKRLRAELVLALAIVHHLVFRQQLTFEEIIGQIRLFCEKYLIIEFVDKNDPYLSDFKLDRFDWYTKENFESILKSQFEIIETQPSTPSETRKLYFCKVK